MEKKKEIPMGFVIGVAVCGIVALAPLVHMVIYHINGTIWHRIPFFGGLAGILAIVITLFTKYSDEMFTFEYELGKDINLQYRKYMDSLANFDRVAMWVYTGIVLLLVTFPFWLPCIVH